MTYYSLQLEAIITHAVSQLTYRWLPLPPVAPTPLFQSDSPIEVSTDRFDPALLRLSDWLAYIEGQRSIGSKSAWLLALDVMGLSSVGLSTVIFDNLLQTALSGAKLIDYFHPLYPFLLKHIPDPPACLTCLGNLDLLKYPKIAVVGSRKASDFAYQESRALGQSLALRGTAVVSGGAVGCDAAAHLGAFESGLMPAPTLVVFAGGLHKPYPQCLRSLFAKLREQDALFVSERLWEYPARPMDFPVRNRIIAGLSSSLAIMQAATKSGALRTASYALEQGREVFVLEHEEDDVRAEGSRQLIDDGALPFTCFDDFLYLVPNGDGTRV